MPGADPFAVIETETPEVAEQEVLQFVRDQYGMNARLELLLGERDQNFRMQCDDGREFVLKIANPAEERMATEFQIEALLHLEAYLASHESPVKVPRIIKTLSGEPSATLESAGTQYLVRVMTYLAGKPLGSTPASPRLCRHLGAGLAHLGQALKGFDHPGSGHGLIWDMQQALELRRIVEHIPDMPLRQDVAACLDDFEAHTLPHFPGVRCQVIHSDLNPENVLVEQNDPDRVAGIIDFGDMLKAPLIVDVAIGASYLRVFEGNPLSKIAEFLFAYHSVTPLELIEIDMLYDLIKTRLAATVSILCWRATLRGADDPYLRGAVASEGSAAEFLRILLDMPRDNARQIFRQICASAGAALSERL